MPDTVLIGGSSCLEWTFRTPHAPNRSGRGGRTATYKFYALRDNLRNGYVIATGPSGIRFNFVGML